MRRMRWLVVASLVIASGVALLAGPIAVAAEGNSPIVRFTGVVDEIPENEGDPWLIDGQEVQIVEGTNLVEATGAIEAGSEVYVVARQAEDGSLEAILIRSQPPVQAAHRFRWVRAVLDRAYSLVNRFAVRWQSIVQSRNQALTRTEAQAGEQERLQTQEQFRSREESQLRDQLLRAQEQDQTQTQDRTRTQEQSRAQDQTQVQDGAQNQMRTRRGFGGR